MGAVSTALTGVLPGLIERLARSAPGLKLQITPGDSRSLYEKVLGGELDAAILVRPPFTLPKALALQVLKVEPLILIAPAAQAALAPDTLLREHPFIRYDAQSWGGQIAQRYLDEQLITPQLLCELDALETIVMLVAQGMGYRWCRNGPACPMRASVPGRWAMTRATRGHWWCCTARRRAGQWRCGICWGCWAALAGQGCSVTPRTTRPMLRPCSRIDDSTTM